MSMSQDDICNAAIALARGESIETIDDNDSVSAELCRRFYENTYQGVLRNYKFRCAYKRANLSSLAATPIGEDWGSQFQLPVAPNLFLKMLRLGTPTDKFAIEGTLLLTDNFSDESTIDILYIARVLEGLLDPLAATVIYYTLAIRIAYNITRSGKRSKELREELKTEILPDAEMASSQDQNLYREFQTHHSWISRSRSSRNNLWFDCINLV